VAEPLDAGDDQLDRPTIAVVIPTYNSDRTLGWCLASVRREFPVPHELVVVDDSRTTDLTRSLCAVHDVDLVVDEAGMAESRNIGARASRSEYILHLDSDMAVPFGFREALEKQLAESRADVLVIPERSIGEGAWIRARQIDKEVVSHLRIGEAARLVRRTAMEKVGGYDPTLLGGEDFDFDRRLRASGARVSRLEDCCAIIHDDGLIALAGLARKKYFYGKSLSAFEQRNGSGLYGLAEVARRVGVGTSWAFRENWWTGARYLCLKGVEFGAGWLGRTVAVWERPGRGPAPTAPIALLGALIGERNRGPNLVGLFGGGHRRSRHGVDRSRQGDLR
jgi:GT2 family glycosyltransferase